MRNAVNISAMACNQRQAPLFHITCLCTFFLPCKNRIKRKTNGSGQKMKITRNYCVTYKLHLRSNRAWQFAPNHFFFLPQFLQFFSVTRENFPLLFKDLSIDLLMEGSHDSTSQINFSRFVERRENRHQFVCLNSLTQCTRLAPREISSHLPTGFLCRCGEWRSAGGSRRTPSAGLSD